MYLTWKEQHIAVNARLQEMMGNRELVVHPQEIDLRLNRAQRQFVDTRMSKTGTIKKEGFEDIQKRYDDLRELKVRATLPTFNATEYVYSILPKNYLHLINDSSYIYRTCHTYTRTLTTVNESLITVPFPTDSTTGVTASFYTNCVLTVNSVAICTVGTSYPLFKGFTTDSKFMFVNLIKWHINTTSIIYDCYWEKYGDVYVNEAFILVSKGAAITSATMTYTKKDTTTSSSSGSVVTTARSQVTFTSAPTPIKRPNDLCDTEYEQDLIVDPLSKKNRWEKPLSSLQNNLLLVYKFPDFDVYQTSILYLREPRMIDSSMYQDCELSVADQIVDLAVQEIYSDISNPNYRNVVTENLIKE